MDTQPQPIGHEVMEGSIVYVVDDDPAARDAVKSRISGETHAEELYSTPEDFLQQFDRSRQGCLIVDARATGWSGRDLQQRLSAEKINLPIVMITGFHNFPSLYPPRRCAPITFLERPCSSDQVWEWVAG